MSKNYIWVRICHKNIFLNQNTFGNDNEDNGVKIRFGSNAIRVFCENSIFFYQEKEVALVKRKKNSFTAFWQ